MEFLRQLFHGKGYIDGITIINLDGEILFSAKLNSKFSNRKEREAYQALVGQNFFDVFENLNAKNSSMIRAMEVGLPVYVENQLLQTKGQMCIRDSLCSAKMARFSSVPTASMSLSCSTASTRTLDI